MKKKGYTISNEDAYGDLINIRINTRKTIKSSSDSEDSSEDGPDVAGGPIGRQFVNATQPP